MAILIVEHNGTLEGASLSGRVLIGRRSSNHVVVKDPAVSRIHAWIDTADQRFCVTDAGSRTGTFVNGERVVGKAFLSDGDRISVGPANLIFRANQSLPAGVSQLDFDRGNNGTGPDADASVDGGILFECACGAPLWIAADFAGRLGKCRFCGAVVRVPHQSGVVATVVDVVSVAPRAPATTRATAPALPPPTPTVNAIVATTTSTCGICQSGIAVGESSTTCPSCGVTFHADCWTENFGCSSYGCSQVNVLAAPEPDPTETPTTDESLDNGVPSAASQAIAEVENAKRIPPEYALLSASLAGTLLGALTFGVPALIVLVIILVYLKRRRGLRPHRVVIVAAVISLLGIAGGVTASYFRWIDNDDNRIRDDIMHLEQHG